MAKSESNAKVPSDFLTKLRRALARDGDFPASAKAVNKLLTRASNRNVTLREISNIILKEPSLSARILHVVNSSFYNRGAPPIKTISDAVTRLGLRNVAEVCSGLVLFKKFVPAARSDGSFADCLKQALFTSILARSLEAELARVEARAASETSYLAGCFASLGLLLTGFFFPDLYKTAVTRRREQGEDLDTSIERVTGHTPFALSIQVIRSLGLPGTFEEILADADALRPGGSGKSGGVYEKILNFEERLSAILSDAGVPPPEPPKEPQETRVPEAATGTISPELAPLTKVVACAHLLSQTAVFGKSREELELIIQSFGTRFGIGREVFELLLARLPEEYAEQCASLEITPSPLPDFVLGFARAEQTSH